MTIVQLIDLHPELFAILGGLLILTCGRCFTVRCDCHRKDVDESEE